MAAVAKINGACPPLRGIAADLPGPARARPGHRSEELVTTQKARLK